MQRPALTGAGMPTRRLFGRGHPEVRGAAPRTCLPEAPCQSTRNRVDPKDEPWRLRFTLDGAHWSPQEHAQSIVCRHFAALCSVLHFHGRQAAPTCTIDCSMVPSLRISGVAGVFPHGSPKPSPTVRVEPPVGRRHMVPQYAAPMAPSWSRRASRTRGEERSTEATSPRRRMR